MTIKLQATSERNAANECNFRRLVKQETWFGSSIMMVVFTEISVSSYLLSAVAHHATAHLRISVSVLGSGEILELLCALEGAWSCSGALLSGESLPLLNVHTASN